MLEKVIFLITSLPPFLTDVNIHLVKRLYLNIPIDYNNNINIKSSLNLAVIQVAEPSDDLLLVQLICLQLHTPDGLHGAVVLQPLITSHDHLRGRTFVQLEKVTFL